VIPIANEAGRVSSPIVTAIDPGNLHPENIHLEIIGLAEKESSKGGSSYSRSKSATRAYAAKAIQAEVIGWNRCLVR
jgi:hypothetical protein